MIEVSKLVRWLLILSFLAFVGQILLHYFDDQPSLVIDTYEQLRVNPEIKRAVGDAKGYSFNKFDIEGIDSLPAKLEMTLIGRKSIDLTVLVDSSQQVFEVVNFEIDSVYNE